MNLDRGFGDTPQMAREGHWLTRAEVETDLVEGVITPSPDGE
jgi:hypothetical protein